MANTETDSGYHGNKEGDEGGTWEVGELGPRPSVSNWTLAEKQVPGGLCIQLRRTAKNRAQTQRGAGVVREACTFQGVE